MVLLVRIVVQLGPYLENAVIEVPHDGERTLVGVLPHVNQVDRRLLEENPLLSVSKL